MELTELGAAMVVLLAVLFILVKMYCSLSLGFFRDKTNAYGKTLIISGGNSGIGYELAYEFARRGGRVIMGVRTLSSGLKARKEIISFTGNRQIDVVECDLASFKSIRGFAKNVLALNTPIYGLVLNAGMASPLGRHLTVDGNEMQFQINHLGHFFLTNLLVPSFLVQRSETRIVIVSSLLHEFARVDFENLKYDKYIPDPFYTYCFTKLCNIWFCTELTRRLKGTNVTVNCLHPGLVRTSINRQIPWFAQLVVRHLLYFFNKKPFDGAQTPLYLLLSQEVSRVSGKYFVDCKPRASSRHAQNSDYARKCWRISEKLCKFRPGEMYHVRSVRPTESQSGRATSQAA